MTGRKHKCAAEGCGAQIPLGMLMCRKDWSRVPRDTQQWVYRSWNRGSPTVEYLAAVDEAIAAVR